MITLLSHVEPADNLNRWYLVSIQSTLFFPCAVIIAWGRRDNDFQQWRAISVETPAQAQELARRIVKKKLQRGYHICPQCETTDPILASEKLITAHGQYA